MRGRSLGVWGGGMVLLALLLVAPSALGELAFADGQWRLELSGMSGLHMGSRDRSGDLLVTGTVDYEFPASSRCTLGLRLMPLFFYEQDNGDSNGRWWDEGAGNDHNVWGAGFGLTGRVYSVKDEYRGWFGEIQANVILHDEQIRGNGANLNFLTGVGVGYEFKCDWHAVVKVQHISNASLDGDNDGANVLGIGIGYRF